MATEDAVHRCLDKLQQVQAHALEIVQTTAQMSEIIKQHRPAQECLLSLDDAHQVLAQCIGELGMKHAELQIALQQQESSSRQPVEHTAVDATRPVEATRLVDTQHSWKSGWVEPDSVDGNHSWSGCERSGWGGWDWVDWGAGSSWDQPQQSNQDWQQRHEWRSTQWEADREANSGSWSWRPGHSSSPSFPAPQPQREQPFSLQHPQVVARTLQLDENATTALRQLWWTDVGEYRDLVYNVQTSSHIDNISGFVQRGVERALAFATRRANS